MFCKSCQKEIPHHLIHGLTCPVCAADLRITGREDVEPPPVPEGKPVVDTEVITEPTPPTPPQAAAPSVIVVEQPPQQAPSPPRRRGLSFAQYAMAFLTAIWLGGSVPLGFYSYELGRQNFKDLHPEELASVDTPREQRLAKQAMHSWGMSVVRRDLLIFTGFYFVLVAGMFVLHFALRRG